MITEEYEEMETNSSTIFYSNVYLGIVLILRCITIFMWDSYFMFSEWFEPYLELMIIVFAFFSLVDSLHEIKEKEPTMKNAPFSILNNGVIIALSLLNLITISMNIASKGLVFDQMSQIFTLTSLLFIVVDFLYPLLVKEKRNSIIIYGSVGVIFLLMVASTNYVNASIIAIQVPIATFFISIITISLIISLFIGLKKLGRESIVHEKREKTDFSAYGLFALSFFIIVLLSSAFAGLFFLVTFMFFIVLMNEIDRKSPPFAFWWLGIMFLFMITIIMW